MWQCSKCDRFFQKVNQSHICGKRDVGELFMDKPDDLVMAWDALTTAVMEWQPNVYSASSKSIVYASKKAWLIVKPLKSELDVKFYCDEKVEHSHIKKHTHYANKYAHHVRISKENEVNTELLTLLKIGYDYSIRSA